MPDDVEHAAERPATPGYVDQDPPGQIAQADFAAQLWKGVWILSSALGPLFAAVTLQAVNIAHMLNGVTIGSKQAASPASTKLLTCALLLAKVAALVGQEFWGQAGRWWGRRCVLSAASVFVFLGAVFLMIEAFFETSALLLVASSFAGLASGLIMQAMAYTADISLGSRFTSNIGKVKGAVVAGVLAGMLFHILIRDFVVECTAAVVLAAAGVILTTCFLPDWSPMLEERVSPTWEQVARTFAPRHMYCHLRSMTAHAKLLLAYHFCAAASFHSMLIWMFSYAIERFRFDIASCDAFFTGSFLSVLGAVALGTLLFQADRGANLVVWATPLFSAMASFGPGSPVALWASIPLIGLAGLGVSLVEALYFGQANEAKRGEMASLLSVTTSLGAVLGVITCGPLSAAWVSSFEKTGKTGLDATVPSPALLQMLFDIVGAACFYVARLHFGDQDKFGSSALVIKGGLGTSSAPANESAAQSADPDAEASNA